MSNERNWWNKLKQNHLLMMVLCCLLPLVIILLAIQSLGVSRNYAWWIVLLLCPVSHYFMMKHMHAEHSKNSSNVKETDKADTPAKESCH